MKTITLIRHTQPDIPAGICYGHMDVDVADSFAVEAPHVSGWLKHPDLIISSPLKRSYKLAEYLARQYRCELQLNNDLMELNFGDWEGRAWGDIARSEIDAWSADVLHYIPRNGESAQQMMMRVQRVLLDLAQRSQQHIALVAHGGSIRALLAQSGGIPLTQTLGWQIEYGAVITLR